MKLMYILKEMDLFQTAVPRSSIHKDEITFMAQQAWEEMVKRKQQWSDIEKQILAGRFSPVMNYNTAAGRPVNTPLTNDELSSVKSMVDYYMKQAQGSHGEQ